MRMNHIFEQRFLRQGIAGLIAIGWIWSTSVAADPPNVLDVPMIMQQQAVDNAKALALLRSGDRDGAKLILRQCVTRVPHDLMAVYNLACAHALLGQTDEALEMLRAALQLGFRAKQQLKMDDDLASLRDKPEFAEILKGCDEPPPKQTPGWHYEVKVAEPKGSTLTVDDHNMTWNAMGRVMQVFVSAKESGKDRLSAGSTGALGDKLMQWYADGTAAGNVGDLYDNHDRAHAKLDISRYPQLTNLAFGPETHKRQLDNGPQRLFLYVNAEVQKGSSELGNPNKSENTKTSDGSSDKAIEPNRLTITRTIVIGNSSTAMTGSAMWRSMPRYLLTSAGGAELLTQHYTNNHLYVYPEHKDHDAGHDDANGWGDVYFANTPYYLISQGSSGSDQPLLDSLAATLSALQPETKQLLRDRGLIAPTLQMIFRRCYQRVHSDQDYLSGVAHPTVFEGNQVNADAMIERAHAMKPDEVPPVALMRVVKDWTADPSIDYFDAQPSENALTTPFALTRLSNSTEFWREMTISTAGSMDINHRPLEFHWVVLRGQADLIKIEEVPGDRQARRVRVGYHPRRPIQPGATIESSRVDIAVFAHNGVNYSAPAILSIQFPDNETRVYDDQKRIVSVDYANRQGNYVDPAVIAERSWKDEYHYDAAGKRTGWTRTRGTEHEEFNAEGKLLIPAKDDKPASVRSVTYQRLNYPDGRAFILQKVVEE